MSDQDGRKAPSDQDAEQLLDRVPAGVDTAMRVMEEAEQVYFGAIAATSETEMVTIASTTDPSTLAEPR